MRRKDENTKALGLWRCQLSHWIAFAGLSSDKLVHARLAYVAAQLLMKANADELSAVVGNHDDENHQPVVIFRVVYSPRNPCHVRC